MTFLQRAEELKESILINRRYLHENAELGFDLPITLNYIVFKLREIGLEPKILDNSGVTALIKGKSGGKTILLRADMDALPMGEYNDLPFKSKTAAAHTCGHDMHSSMLLAAAQMLVEKQDELQGNVKLLFQPAEETMSGAKAMLKSGILDNPTVDSAFAIHVMLDDLPGAICYGKGYMTSSCNAFKIKIQGKGCHGAMPHTGIDPINVGVHIYLALHELIAREVPPSETVALSIGEFNAGNQANIIPDTAQLQGTLRVYNEELRARLMERIHTIIQKTAETFGAVAEYEELFSAPATYTNEDMLEELLEAVRVMSPDIKEIPNYRISPSDDFACIAEKVPTVYMMLCAKQEGNAYQHHNPRVVFNEAAMPLGAALHAQCAFEWLKKHK